MSKIELYNADCLEKMKDIPNKSINMILCDLLYGTTDCKWDVIIPFNDYIVIEQNNKKQIMYLNDYMQYAYKNNIKYDNAIKYFDMNKRTGLWTEYNRIIKDNCPIVLFGSEPFSSKLRMSNIKKYKYDWYWNKNSSGNILCAKYMPLKIIENIIVFNSTKKYYPQFTYSDKDRTVESPTKQNSDMFLSIKSGKFYKTNKK